ncbi:MAG: type II secretion system protein [Clostridia bacterium]|nr:type II secretion system protein [Clostridia bacterium]
MRKSNKKGFTIVELVNVIAVIAILSAVLIPTFGGITEKAKNSARDQEAKNAFTNYLIACEANPEEGKYILVKDGETSYYYLIDNDGQIDLKGEVTTDKSDDVVWCSNHADAAVDATGHDEACDNCGVAIDCTNASCNHTPVTNP